jgi:hypothetical protein
MSWFAVSSDIIATFTTFFSAVWCYSSRDVTSSPLLRLCTFDHFVPKSSLAHVTYFLLCVRFSKLLCVPFTEYFWSVSSKQCSLCSFLNTTLNFPLVSLKCGIKLLLIFFTSKQKYSVIIIFEPVSVFFKYLFLTKTVNFTKMCRWPPFFPPLVSLHDQYS